MKQGKHLLMIRSFHLADWFTLGNAACGVGALFSVMTYLQTPDVLHLYFACALVALASYSMFSMAALRAGASKVRFWGASWTPFPM